VAPPRLESVGCSRALGLCARVLTGALRLVCGVLVDRRPDLLVVRHEAREEMLRVLRRTPPLHFGVVLAGFDAHRARKWRCKLDARHQYLKLNDHSLSDNWQKLFLPCF